MKYLISKEDLKNFDNNIRKEWVLTNGIGGYAGSSVTGAHNRTHQAYLIACLHPPVSRYVVFSKTNEAFIQNGIKYDLSTNMHYNHKVSTGYQYLDSFEYDGNVCYTYKTPALTVNKYITLTQGKNTVSIGYEFQNNSPYPVYFTITPLMNYREHSQNVSQKDLLFDCRTYKNAFTLIPKKDSSIEINLAFSEGTLVKRTNIYDIDMQLQTEVDNEVTGLDCHYTPYDINFTIPADCTYKYSLVCSVEDDFIDIISNRISKDYAFDCINQQHRYIDDLLATAGYNDLFAKQLTIAANHFLAYRESTGYKTILAGLPWFTDWGRDTMIAFTGLTLCTRQYQSARDILLTFSQYVKNGMIPNMFPDNGQEPLYNTADASLWYFYATYKYLEYIKKDSLLTEADYNSACDFIQQNIYPCLKEIISGYKNGTDFSIYMDTDHLIHAGGGLDQVTWMDVRVGDWVPTPRHGKPVEINALWYNALKIMEFLSDIFEHDSSEYSLLANQVADSFNNKFWNASENCLYDVIEDNDVADATIRPNQIYAVSLPFSLVSKEKEKAIVDTVYSKLYVGVGLRSLDPSHKDYHPIYVGALQKRDAAYHQGTAWGFLLGGFVSAYTKIYGPEPALLNDIKKHLTEGCIGSISEIFDGDSPNTCRGCYAQAWSVGEVLRCYVENILE